MGIFKTKIDFDPTDPTDHDRIGSYLVGLGGTVAQVDGSNQLAVVDAAGNALLTTIDADTSNIASDTAAMVVDLAAIEVLLTSIDVDTGNIASDTAAMVVDLAAIEVLLTSIDGDTSSLATLVLAEDDAAADGGPGVASFAKRQDTLATDTSADGDLAYLKVNAAGALYTSTSLESSVGDDDASTENPILVSGVAHDTGSALGTLSADGDKGHLLLDLYRRVFTNDACNVAWQVSSKSITDTSAQLDATPLAGRTKVLIQNQGSKSIWVKNTTAVADATSIEIPKNSAMEFPFGEALEVHGISEEVGGVAAAFMEAA